MIEINYNLHEISLSQDKNIVCSNIHNKILYQSKNKDKLVILFKGSPTIMGHHWGKLFTKIKTHLEGTELYNQEDFFRYISFLLNKESYFDNDTSRAWLIKTPIENTIEYLEKINLNRQSLTENTTSIIQETKDILKSLSLSNLITKNSLEEKLMHFYITRELEEEFNSGQDLNLQEFEFDGENEPLETILTIENNIKILRDSHQNTSNYKDKHLTAFLFFLAKTYLQNYHLEDDNSSEEKIKFTFSFFDFLSQLSSNLIKSIDKKECDKVIELLTFLFEYSCLSMTRSNDIFKTPKESILLTISLAKNSPGLLIYATRYFYSYKNIVAQNIGHESKLEYGEKEDGIVRIQLDSNAQLFNQSLKVELID